MTDIELFEEAKKARLMAYAPYSGFKVGAALLTKSGKLYHGCNIENAAYTPTNCAERTAFFKAVSPDELCAPCGVCRQVMAEFCNPDTFEIILANGKGKIKGYSLKDILPFGFGPKDLA